MLGPAFTDGRAENEFRADGKGHGEDHRPEAFVRVEEHGRGEPWNKASREEIQEITQATGEADFAVLRAGVDPIQQHRNGDGSKNRNYRCGPGLFEPEHSMAENIPKDHQARKIPQREEPKLGVLIRIEKKGRIEGLGLHWRVLLFRRADIRVLRSSFCFYQFLWIWQTLGEGIRAQANGVPARSQL